MLTTEAPEVHELALHWFTTKEAGVLAMSFSNTRDADEGVDISYLFEGCGSWFVRSCPSVSVPLLWDAGVVITVLDDGIPVISVSNRAVVASGLVATVLDKVFLLFLVFTSDRASRFS